MTANSGMIRKVVGRKARLCCDACLDGFKADRKLPLIYPSFNVEGEIMSVEKASVECHFCAYCQVDLD